MSYTETEEDCKRWGEEQLIEANEDTMVCPKCGSTMFKTIYGWYKCRNEFCFYVQTSGERE